MNSVGSTLPGNIAINYLTTDDPDAIAANIRTAIIAWLYARRSGGQIALRIDDREQRNGLPGLLQLARDFVGDLAAHGMPANQVGAMRLHGAHGGHV